MRPNNAHLSCSGGDSYVKLYSRRVERTVSNQNPIQAIQFHIAASEGDFSLAHTSLPTLEIKEPFRQREPTAAAMKNERQSNMQKSVQLV